MFSYRRLACQSAAVLGFALTAGALLGIFYPEALAALLAAPLGSPAYALPPDRSAQILALGLMLFLGGHIPMYMFWRTKRRIRRKVESWFQE